MSAPKRLDEKLARIHAGRASRSDFIVADAKQADMAFGVTGAPVLEIDHKSDLRAFVMHSSGKATVLDNIDTGLLANGMPEQVEQACCEAMEIMRRHGRFILGPGSALGTNTPAANIHALVESARRFGTF